MADSKSISGEVKQRNQFYNILLEIQNIVLNSADNKSWQDCKKELSVCLEKFDDILASEEFTTSEYWDCNCEENYIHPSSQPEECPLCGYSREDGCDSHIEEVEYFLNINIRKKSA